MESKEKNQFAYDHLTIEKKWQQHWEKNKTFKTNIGSSKPKQYILDMFPYPSGSGLHVGHPKGYTATDVVARFKRFQGFEVLHPIGWDAFGLPAEQYALKTGNDPSTFTLQNIDNFRKQLKSLGFSFDYDLEVNTTDENYYKWTQWIFLQLYKHDLAKIETIDVNYCPELGTVLANEEILTINGKMVSERGEFPVYKKPMRQWVLKITKYADKLLELDDLDWPNGIKELQKKWIGKSYGHTIAFKVNGKISIDVFTTRLDTLAGVSYIVLAPEHVDVLHLTTNDNLQQVKKYIENTKLKNDFERQNNVENITGCFLGSYAVNPLNNEQVPIYIADYVLGHYGTGAVMAVPAHDKRDYKFAKKFNLPINYVIECSENDCYEGDGKHINSGCGNGLNIDQTKKVFVKELEKNNAVTESINYKLKDWIFSRQRYWGEPFPIFFDEDNKSYPVDEHELPITLPKVQKIEIGHEGQSPLSKITNWIKFEKDGKIYTRDSNTMPQWAGSCWYYLAYILKDGNEYIPLNSKEAKILLDKWLPVDLYVGGQEHAVLHLLYARFWHRFLFDIGITSKKEPFQKLFNQGIILGENGEKMSKSKGNVVNPDDLVQEYGADAFRLYEMFMGPLDATLPWSNDNLQAMRKWIDRMYLAIKNSKIQDNDELNYEFNLMVKKVTDNLGLLKFNVSISEFMIFVTQLINKKIISKNHLKSFLVMLNTFIPHISSEIWTDHFKENINEQVWPTINEKDLIKSQITLPVQIDGKTRVFLQIPTDADEKTIIELLKQDFEFNNKYNINDVKRIIYVKNKIINLIMGK